MIGRRLIPPKLGNLSYETQAQLQGSTQGKHEEKKLSEDEAPAKLGLVPCPYCKALGGVFYVVCELDLRAHVSASHFSEEAV